LCCCCGDSWWGIGLGYLLFRILDHRAGWRLHGSLDQRQLYRACYGLLIVTALKLLWHGVSGYLA
jgi:hypothetical protein